jgi:hypothetical protein
MKKLTTRVTFVAVLVIAGCAIAPQEVAQTNSVGLSSAETVAGQIPSVGMPSAVSAAGQLPSVGTAAGSVAGVAPLAGQVPSLVNILVQQLGITPNQAMGGAGSIFSMAQQSMSPTSFSQLSNAVPGMGQLLAAAPALGGSASGAGSLMGSAASALGGSSLGNMVALASSFQNLGMGSGMMNQFIPIILQYVQGTGGSSTMGLLQSALLP